MNYCHIATLGLAKMQDQESFTLNCCPCSEWGGKHAAIVFAPKGGQNLIYVCLQPITSWVTQDGQPIIDDALLTFIFSMEQGASHFGVLL
jgi:hypothetical protein